MSLDSRGRAMDNIFVERLWRTVECENTYLNECVSVLALTTGLRSRFSSHNAERSHQGLGYQTPDEAHSDC